jgi:hypothetical protein
LTPAIDGGDLLASCLVALPLARKLMVLIDYEAKLAPELLVRRKILGPAGNWNMSPSI